MADKSLIVKLIGNASSLRSAFAEAGTAAQGFGGQTDAIGQKLSSFGSKMTLGVTLPIVAGLTAATQAAADDAQEQAVLQHALEQNVGATDSLVASTEEWITSMQMATGVSDTELRGAMTELVNKGSDVAESQAVIQAALDLAAGAGVNFGAAIDALAKAADGNTAGLRRMGIETKSAEGSMLSFDEILAQVETRMGGSAAAAADTTAGRMAIAQQKFAEAAETLGTALIPVMDQLATKLAAVAQWFSDLSPQMQSVIVNSGLAVAAVGPLASLFGNVAKGVAGVVSIWPKLVTAFTNPYVLLAAGVIGAIAGAFAIFSGKAADAAQRAEELGDAMADGTPKATAFGDAVLAWLSELDATDVETLNQALTEMGTSYSELVGSVANGTLSLADFNAKIDAAVAGHAAFGGALAGGRGAMDAESQALRDLQAEVNATSLAAGEAERAIIAQGDAMGSTATLAQIMQTGTQTLATAQGELAGETEEATGAMAAQAETMRQQTDPAFAYLSALQQLRDANANLVTVQGDVEASADDLAAAELDVVAAYIGVQDAGVNLRANPDAIVAMREAEVAAGITAGSVHSVGAELDSAFSRGDMSGLRGRLTGLSGVLDGVRRDVDAIGSAFGRLPTQVNIGVNVGLSGPGASYLSGRVGPT